MTYDVIYDGKNKWRYKICEICFGSQSSFVSWKINTSQCFTNCMWKQKTKKNTAVEKKTTVVFFYVFHVYGNGAEQRRADNKRQRRHHAFGQIVHHGHGV